MENNTTTLEKRMELIIDDKRTISELQMDFASEFPYLKLEFLAHPFPEGVKNIKKELHKGTEKIGDCRKVHNSGAVALSDDMTVTQLENIFEKEYGLHLQVFRKSGKLWLITTATDSWTLGVQNEHGRELSEGYEPEADEPADYHEQE
jgi:hypothetical protein